MAESTVKSPSTSNTLPSETIHHPALAVVLLATGGPEVLRAALHALAPACVEAAVELCVVWDGDAPPTLGEWPGLAAQCIRAEVGSSPADRRQQAAGVIEADILMFTDDRAAVPLPWNDILAFRLGLLRRSSAPMELRGLTPPAKPVDLLGGGAPA